MKLKVQFIAEFETEIEVETMEDVPDALTDISIPETKDCKYVEDSFDVQSIAGEDGKEIDW